MNIQGATLLNQYRLAKAEWPFIEAVEKAHGLPALLLYAIGSRETNLRNIKGDYGQRKSDSSPRYHGFGVWQRDSAAWGVGESYLKDVRKQAEDAAKLLAANHKTFGRWDAAVAAYNCGPGHVTAALEAGRPVDRHTAGGDYSADVLGRHAYLGSHVKGTATPAKTYTVRSGDTLSAIAAKQHTTVAVLVAKNGIKDPDHILVGQVLRLP